MRSNYIVSILTSLVSMIGCGTGEWAQRRKPGEIYTVVGRGEGFSEAQARSEAHMSAMSSAGDRCVDRYVQILQGSDPMGLLNPLLPIPVHSHGPVRIFRYVAFQRLEVKCGK